MRALPDKIVKENKMSGLDLFLKKIASASKLDTFLSKLASIPFNKRIPELSIEDLFRLSPDAAYAKLLGQQHVPIYLTGTGFERPSLKEYIRRLVRNDMKPKRYRSSTVPALFEVPGQGDLLAKKKPGEVLERQMNIRDHDRKYW